VPVTPILVSSARYCFRVGQIDVVSYHYSKNLVLSLYRLLREGLFLAVYQEFYEFSVLRAGGFSEKLAC
jgi:hypothetical protein